MTQFHPGSPPDYQVPAWPPVAAQPPERSSWYPTDLVFRLVSRLVSRIVSDLVSGLVFRQESNGELCYGPAGAGPAPAVALSLS
jgi:hypothetical protein